MFNVFGYLRNQARSAVLSGVADALAEVATDDRPADLDQLRRMLAEAGSGAKALPAAKVDADDTAPPAETDAVPTGTGGKRKK